MACDLRNLWRPLPDLSLAPHGPELALRIARAQLRTLFKEGRANLAATIAGVPVWWFALHFTSAGLPAVLWGVANLLCVLAIAVVHTRYAKAAPTDGELRRWEVIFGWVMLAMGSSWGWLAFVAPAEYGSYVATWLLLVLAGSLSAFVNYRPGIAWFSVPCVVLIPVGLAINGGSLNLLVAAGFLIVSVLMVRQATVQSALVTQTMQNAEERLALLQELEARRLEAHHANQAKTRFLAAASHDLRQPIHSIALLTDALARRPGSDLESLGQITASVEAMDDMLGALLQVSKLDAGALPLNLTSFTLDTLLKRLKLQFEAQAGERGIQLDMRPGPWRVSSDAHQLQRILANLVSNAVRFTAVGGVLVRCRCRGQRVWIQVWDSGAGIAPADRARIFEEFVQVAGHTGAGPRQGIGLGLSIVKRLSKRLGCEVQLRSRPGRGSVFSVAVPLRAEAAAPAAGVAPPPPALEALLAGQLVLLIDDDPLARGGLRALLEACQCHVLACRSTRDALEQVEQSLRTPDLVLSDYRLGEGDNGLDAIAAVRSAVDGPLPAVLITAELQRPREAAALLGVEVLGKPLRPQELALALGRLLPPQAGAGKPGGSWDEKS